MKNWNKFRAAYKHGTDNLNRVHEAMTQLSVSGQVSTSCRERPCPDSNGRQHPTVFSFPGLTSRPWWGRFEHIPLSIESDLNFLENNVAVIRDEFNKINELYLQGDHNDNSSGWAINVQHRWRMYHLVNQGVPHPSNGHQCPKTIALVKQLNYALAGCVFGYASFSVVEPGAEIRTHCGPTNARLRCHLGVVIPPECELIVNDQSKSWKEGECLLFDDSYPHSVIHRGNSDRAVLLIDFWHPDLRREERAALRSAFSSSTITC